MTLDAGIAVWPAGTARPPLPPLSAGVAEALDDEDALAGCTQWQAGPDGAREALTTFTVQGMYCAACAGLIEAAVGAVPGVRIAEVHAAARRLRVQWDPVHARASALVDAVHRAGYRALPANAADAQEALREESRRALWRLFVAGLCMMQVMMLTVPVYMAEPGDIAPDLLALLRWGAWVLSLPVLLFSAGPFFGGAWRALKARRIGMDVPVALGIAITFVAGTGATFDPNGAFGAEPYLDSMTMFVAFLLGGRWLELRARARSTEALDALLQRLPDSVERLRADGSIERVARTRLRVGDRVRVAAGQAFPGDGTLLEGQTEVDEALLSGESRPVPRRVGDAAIGGSINLGAPVTLRLDRVGEGTRYQQIVDLVHRALTERPASVRAVDRLAGPFLWTVLVLAAASGAVWSVIDPVRAPWVAVSVLIVTCPCALALATPASLLAAAGAMARRGVLVQRLDAFEVLARCDLVCFDKTGTVTQDALQLAETLIGPAADATALLGRAASLAAQSRHPLSQALAQALEASAWAWTEVQEIVGRGIQARDAQGRVWRLGAPAWVGVPDIATGRPAVALATQGASAGQEWIVFGFDEVLRPQATQAVQDLADQGVALRMLSGDAPESVAKVARALGIGDAEGGATPERKLEALADWQRAGHRVVMVGDGLNDGPVLARADVSFALAHGSALAQQRSDFIVLGSRLGEVAAARRLALRTRRVMRQNLGWAAAYNAACVPLAMLGWLPAWAAGAGMALSSLAVVLNALRLAR